MCKISFFFNLTAIIANDDTKVADELEEADVNLSGLSDLLFQLNDSGILFLKDFCKINNRLPLFFCQFNKFRIFFLNNADCFFP